MSNDLKRIRELERAIKRIGGSVVGRDTGGRHHHHLIVATRSGGTIRVPVAGGFGKGHARHQANAITEIRRRIRGETT